MRAGCGGRGSVRRESAKTMMIVADGKDVWSWRPDAGAMTGARKPGPRGERDISRNTIAWGMPDVSGASAVNTRVHTPTTKRTRGCGCIGHPAFPAPSSISEGSSANNSGAICVAGLRLHAPRSSCPAHAGHPVRRSFSDQWRAAVFTGSPGQAGRRRRSKLFDN